MPTHTLLEITEKCQFACPICDSRFGPDGKHLPLAQIENVLNRFAKDAPTTILKITGGEPTIHPDIERILATVRALPFDRIILDTNGLRISQDDEFVRRLMDFTPSLELHLQFDSLRPSVLQELRGEDLSDLRRRALFRLNKLNAPTLLTVAVKKGINDREIGSVIEFAKQQPCVKGILLHPIKLLARTVTADAGFPAMNCADLYIILEQLAGYSGPEPANCDQLELRFADNSIHGISLKRISGS
ncbi:MAG TPA: radical SAM protein [Tepidisphaeraceae bacterium]|nr:radical SAM protein [Tepidisphaeraceae bacterium]